jgi:hypothetical protein
MKPKRNLFAENGWDEFTQELEEELEREWWTEDDQMERERDLKEGQQDIDDADDLVNINIG